MKKFFLSLALLVCITACSLNDDDGANFSIAYVPIDSVQLPDTLVLGSNYDFKIYYTKPSACYEFRRVQYDMPRDITQDSTRFAAVINTVFDDVACADVMIPDSTTIKFETRYEYDYIFNFYQGQDADDQPIYLRDTIPVKRP